LEIKRNPLFSPLLLIARPKSRANLRSKMSDGVSKSRASSLVKGFENPAQLGLPKHSPAA